MVLEVFTLRGSKRPHREKSLPLSYWSIPQEKRERGGCKGQETKEGGAECDSVYHSSVVLDSASRWAGNEAEDTH